MPKDTTRALAASIVAKRARNAHLPRCRHCKVNAVTRRKEGWVTKRGLCSTCYEDKDIRNRYPRYDTSEAVSELRRKIKELLISGMTNSEIAEKLGVTRNLVRYHNNRVEVLKKVTSNGAVPAFDWSNQPDLFPCGKCIVEPVTRPLGLCARCQKEYSDWKPRDKSKDGPLVMCLKVHRVVESREKKSCY